MVIMTEQIHIIITAPHTYCRSTADDNHIGGSWEDKYWRVCDARAEIMAKKLIELCRKNNWNVYDYINDEVPRICGYTEDYSENICADLNRVLPYCKYKIYEHEYCAEDIECKACQWQKKVYNKIDELKSKYNKNVYLIDVHSYPFINSFSGSPITILSIPHKSGKQNIFGEDILIAEPFAVSANREINNVMPKNTSYFCNLLGGHTKNSIIYQASSAKVPNILLEIIEDEDLLPDYLLDNISNALIKCIEDHTLEKTNGGGHKYKLTSK